MEKEVLESLYLLKKEEKKNKVELKLEKLLELREKLDNEESTLKEKYYLVRLMTSVANYILTDEIHISREKKALVHILKCSISDIIYDENELDKNKDAQYIIGDIRYSATINKEYLKNKRLVWGNLDIRALRDTSCLDSLEVVGGDLYLSGDAYLPKLKYVFGKIKVDNISRRNLPNLEFLQNFGAKKSLVLSNRFKMYK